MLPRGKEGELEAKEVSEKSEEEEVSNEEEEASELCKLLLGTKEPRLKKGDLGIHFLIMSND
jgi:hypothetical protein